MSGPQFPECLTDFVLLPPYIRWGVALYSASDSLSCRSIVSVNVLDTPFRYSLSCSSLILVSVDDTFVSFYALWDSSTWAVLGFVRPCTGVQVCVVVFVLL